MQILTVMMMMIMMSFLYSALADQGLDCHNDFHSSFTCVWNTSKLNVTPETNCSIRVVVEDLRRKNVMEVQMSADPAQPHIRTATIDFNEKNPIIMSWSKIHEEVTCEGYTEPLAKIKEHKGEYSVVKVAPPPQIVEVRGLHVSWRISFSTRFLTPEYEVQFRSTAQSWTDGKSWVTEETRGELPEEHLFLHQQYVIRIRVKLQELTKAIWSDWSKEYNWTSEVGQIPPTPPTPGLDCHNDFHSSFTCVWNTSKLNVTPETSCSIRVVVKNLRRKNVMEVQMSADPAQPHIRTATIDFNEKNPIIMSWSNIHEEVTCEGYTEPLAKIKEHKGEYSVVKVAPPQIVEVRGLDVSWIISFSTRFLTPEYEVQFRSTAQSWTDGKSWVTEGTRGELPEEHLFLHQQYVIRIRVKLQELTKAIWSDWSKEYNWTSEVGQIPPTPPTPGLDCHNDFHSSFTCVWNTSKLNVTPETNCSIRVVVENFGRKNVMEVQMSADPAQPHIRTATIDFNEKNPIIMSWSNIHEEVTCEGYTEPLAKIKEHKGEYSVVKVAPPPQIVEVRGLHVSWIISFSTQYLTPEYEVQFRSTAQSWTDGKSWVTEETRGELPEEHLFLHQQYVIRIRVKLQELTKAIWSDWSKEYNWTSEVGQRL